MKKWKGVLAGVAVQPPKDENGVVKLQDSFQDGWTEWPVDKR